MSPLAWNKLVLLQSVQYVPKTGDQAAEEEEAVLLNEGGEEREAGVDGEGYDQAPLPAQFVCQATPEKGPHHHSKINNESCMTEGHKTY